MAAFPVSAAKVEGGKNFAEWCVGDVRKYGGERFLIVNV